MESPLINKYSEIQHDSLYLQYSIHYPAMLGTCTIFSATAPLVQTKKGGARPGGAKVKNGIVAVAQKWW